MLPSFLVSELDGSLHGGAHPVRYIKYLVFVALDVAQKRVTRIEVEIFMVKIILGERSYLWLYFLFVFCCFL